MCGKAEERRSGTKEWECAMPIASMVCVMHLVCSVGQNGKDASRVLCSSVEAV